MVANADDITLILTAPEDMPVTRDAIRRYERVTGARLNIRKSKALAVGALDIPYYSEIKVLGLIKSWLNIFY